MFQHILVPTDGSPLSLIALQNAIQLAQRSKARITIIYAQPDPDASVYGEAALMRSIDPAKFANIVGKRYREIQASVHELTDGKDIPCETLCLAAGEPYQAIIATAEKRGCDLIMMASHGYRGIKGLLLGSQTLKVLANSKTPVLVYK